MPSRRCAQPGASRSPSPMASATWSSFSCSSLNVRFAISMRALLALWIKESLVLSRDAHGLAVLFLMPAAFIVIMSLALSDAFNEDGARNTDFAVVAFGGPKVAEPIAQSLAGQGF